MGFVTFERLILGEWVDIGKVPPFNWPGDAGVVHIVIEVSTNTWCTACLEHSWTRFKNTETWIKDGSLYNERSADYVIRSIRVATCLGRLAAASEP